ncbi:MAG TPA: hypothetical protein VG605_23025 [Puia sp.]|nr:hypothetical protein [Puia sp.]
MKQILLLFLGFIPGLVFCQPLDKVVFDASDSVNGYYLAARPFSGVIKGVIVVFTAFQGPESIVPETKLHNVAAANDLLTVYASVGRRVSPGAAEMDRMNKLFAHVVERYKADSTRFAVGGFDVAGMAVLRYAELAREHPEQYVIRPRAVFGIDAPVDLGGLHEWCERQIRKNYPSPSLGDAKAMLDMLNKEGVAVAEWTPFDHNRTERGHEQFLRHTAVRLYYDTDEEWQLKARRNSYYDTFLPDGSDMIDQLLLQGNNRAEFVAAKQPGMRSNGNRNASAFSIMDEVDCVQWVMKELRTYRFDIPDGWGVERIALPPVFAPGWTLKGFEEIRFMPGWGIAGRPDYWSLAYLFWLDGGQKIDAAVLQENIRCYYQGLVETGGGPVKHQIPADKMVTTRVQMKAIKTEADDVSTFAGTVDMLDYMAMKPMRLNFLAHIKDGCNTGHIPVFLELSPKPYDDDIWLQLKQMKKQFSCQE